MWFIERNDAIWIIVQDVMGLQSGQKIMVNLEPSFLLLIHFFD